MKRLKLTSATAIVVGALCFGAPGKGHAAILDTDCGPLPVGGCALASDVKVFLNNGKNQTVVTGNVGANNKGPTFNATSDNGMMVTITLDSGGGWSNITPAGSATHFNGLDITIPGAPGVPGSLGYDFTSVIWSSQLTGTAGNTYSFTADGKTGAVDDGKLTVSDTPNDDKEFGLFADAGTLFSEVNLFSQSGFEEIKQIEIGGLCAIQANGSCTAVVFPTPEPSTIALLAFGVLGTLALSRATNRPR